MEDYIKALKTNKKLLVSTILSAVAFLVLIIGATYAYFGVDQINDTSASTITASTKGVGNVSLVDGNNLRLDITADDMAIPQDNITFWATTDGTPSLTENEVVIASANVIGTGTMYCDYTMNITKTSTTPEKDLFTAFSGWTDPGKDSDQIVLKVDNGESIQIYDFNDSELSFPVSYTGRLTNLTEEAVRNLKASFKIVNLKDVDQTVISGKNVQFAFTFTDFQCELQGDSAETPAPSNPYIGMIGKNLATTLISKAGMWQSGLEDDGYRFTGASDYQCSYDNGNYLLSVAENSTCPNVKKIKNMNIHQMNI